MEEKEIILCVCKKGATLLSDYFQSYLHIKNKYVGMLALSYTVCIRVSLLQAPTHYHF